MPSGSDGTGSPGGLPSISSAGSEEGAHLGRPRVPGISLPWPSRESRSCLGGRVQGGSGDMYEKGLARPSRRNQGCRWFVQRANKNVLGISGDIFPLTYLRGKQEGRGDGISQFVPSWELSSHWSARWKGPRTFVFVSSGLLGIDSAFDGLGDDGRWAAWVAKLGLILPSSGVQPEKVAIGDLGLRFPRIGEAKVVLGRHDQGKKTNCQHWAMRPAIMLEQEKMGEKSKEREKKNSEKKENLYR